EVLFPSAQPGEVFRHARKRCPKLASEFSDGVVDYFRLQQFRLQPTEEPFFENVPSNVEIVLTGSSVEIVCADVFRVRSETLTIPHPFSPTRRTIRFAPHWPHFSRPLNRYGLVTERDKRPRRPPSEHLRPKKLKRS